METLLTCGYYRSVSVASKIYHGNETIQTYEQRRKISVRSSLGICEILNAGQPRNRFVRITAEFRDVRA